MAIVEVPCKCLKKLRTISFSLLMDICDALLGLLPFVQFKNREKKTVLLLVKLQAKSTTLPLVLFMFFKLYKWYQIPQSIAYIPPCQRFLIKNFCWGSVLLSLRKSGRLKNPKSHNNKDCQHSSNYTTRYGRIKYFCQIPGICLGVQDDFQNSDIKIISIKGLIFFN